MARNKAKILSAQIFFMVGFFGCSKTTTVEVSGVEYVQLNDDSTLVVSVNTHMWEETSGGLVVGAEDYNHRDSIYKYNLNSGSKYLIKSIKMSGRNFSWILAYSDSLVSYITGFNFDQWITFEYLQNDKITKYSYGGGRPFITRDYKYYTDYNSVFSIKDGTKDSTYSISGHNSILFFEPSQDVYLVENKTLGLHVINRKTLKTSPILSIPHSIFARLVDSNSTILLQEWPSNKFYYLIVADFIAGNYAINRLSNIPAGYLVKDLSIKRNMVLIVKDRGFGESGSEIKILDFEGQELRSISI
jgi:hypothetical protein